MFKFIQIAIGLVFIAMVWLGSLAIDQKLAFTVFIVLLLIDKFVKFDRTASTQQPPVKHDQ